MAACIAHLVRGRSGEKSSSAAARSVEHGAAGASRSVYRRHEAEKTVLYQIVSRELETFLAEVRDHYEKPLPGYVEKELRDFLDCGILARGFVTARRGAPGRSRGTGHPGEAVGAERFIRSPLSPRVARRRLHRAGHHLRPPGLSLPARALRIVSANSHAR